MYQVLQTRLVYEELLIRYSFAFGPRVGPRLL